MQKISALDPESRSANIVAENIAKLAEFFPEAFTEGRIDFDVLKQLLGGGVDEREEKYGLNWHGKRRARQLALTPSTGTLRPCPEESVDWDTTQNLMIEGDNLEVLKLLQKSYAGKVKLIYIDPPYNTGSDFVYPDDFQDNIKNYLSLTGQLDGEGRRISTNMESSGRFHTDWLCMMYPRLKLARGLLREDGVIFVSCDDNELHNLRMLMNEIFGEENFVAAVIWEKADSPRNSAKQFSEDHDYILVYSRSPDWTPARLPRTDEVNSIYANPDNDPRGPWLPGDPYANHPYSKGQFSMVGPTGRTFSPPPGRFWRVSEERLRQLDSQGRIWWGPKGDARPSIKRYLSEVGDLVPRTLWKKDEVGSNRTSKNEMRELFPESESFDTPKPTRLIERMLRIATDSSENDLILDFFAGSASTAHAVMALNRDDGGSRRYILVQLPEPTERDDYPTIAQITKERLRRVSKKFGGASTVGQAEEAEPNLFPSDPSEIRDEPSQPTSAATPLPDLGFRVFKLDSSNIRAWDPDRGDLSRTLLDSAEHIKLDRSEQDILYEVLLKLGLELTVPIEQRSIGGKTVHSIGAGSLFVCLAPKIGRADVEPLAHGIASWRKEQNPAGETEVVFRDSAFADDVAKSNLTAILQQRGLENVRSL